MLAAEKDTLVVDRIGQAIALQIGVHHTAHGHQAGIVDENIEAAKMFQRGRDNGLPVFLIGYIMVNKKGKRFTNEAQPYEDLVKEQYASEARGESAIPCYLIFDARYRSKYSAGHIKPGKIED